MLLYLRLIVRLLKGFIWKKLQQSWRFTESFLEVSRSPKKKAPVLWLERTEIWPLLGPGTPKIFENLKLLKIWHIILRSKGFFIANTNIDILFRKNQFLEFYDVIKVISKIMKFKNWSKVGNIIVHSTWFFIAIIIKNV